MLYPFIYLESLGIKLFDLGFFKYHMFTYNWIVLSEFHLFRRISRILFSHVIKACFSCADKLNKYCAWLCHFSSPANLRIFISLARTLQRTWLMSRSIKKTFFNIFGSLGGALLCLKHV